MAATGAAETEPLIVDALFDEISESYEDAYGNNAGLERTLHRLNEYHSAGSSILDIGCGPGGPASRLSSAGFNVTGIDVSQNMINYCQKNISGTFCKADMTTFEPTQQFDAIVALYSLFQASYRTTYSMIFKMASWLRPGGTLVLAIIPAEEYVQDLTIFKGPIDYVENHPVPFMGRSIPCTLLTTKGWLRIFQEAGLSLRFVERHVFHPKSIEGKQEHMFITAQRTNLEPLFGPYPQPTFPRAPYFLSQKSWQPFAERLTRHEFDAVLKAVEFNKEVLDIGSGYGELPVAISKQLGKAYAIEPNCDRNTMLINNSKESNVEISQGRAELLPFPDNKFDAVVALWVLHYVDDLEQSLSEMARVVNPEAPNARIVIVQGAPDNDIVNLINKACASIVEESMEGSAIDHQGIFLAIAARVFTKLGFGNVSVARVDAHCNFPEQDLAVRCEKAATVLAEFWYQDHPGCDRMKEAFQPILREHFEEQPFVVGDQAVILIAQPGKPLPERNRFVYVS